MEPWIHFGRGPLFRFAFALMILGLLRILMLTLAGVAEAYRRSPDKIINWREVRRQTVGWLFPISRVWQQRPIYSIISVIFHFGLLIVPIFLAAHVLRWKGSFGFGWKSIPQSVANQLTLLVVITGLALFIGRIGHAGARALSRKQDYLWPLLLIVPFATGYACANFALAPKSYQALMLVHVYSGDLILLLIPFTKIAHCVLAPLSQVVTAVAWKFPLGAGDRVAATLGYADQPSWIEKSRLKRAVGSEVATPSAVAAPVTAKQEVCVK